MRVWSPVANVFLLRLSAPLRYLLPFALRLSSFVFRVFSAQIQTFCVTQQESSNVQRQRFH
jgi:hypothetical protein